MESTIMHLLYVALLLFLEVTLVLLYRAEGYLFESEETLLLLWTWLFLDIQMFFYRLCTVIVELIITLCIWVCVLLSALKRKKNTHFYFYYQYERWQNKFYKVFFKNYFIWQSKKIYHLNTKLSEL